MKRTPDDDDFPFEITWVRPCDPLPESAKGFHHDHDEELGMYWYGEPLAAGPEPRLPKAFDVGYWLVTGRLVRQYLILQAGRAYSSRLRQEFVRWLQASPERRRRYIDGDDMDRASLVDAYLHVAR